MAAISTGNRILNVLILSGVVVLLANEQTIISTMGVYLGASALVLVTLGFLWLREGIKESGLMNGDLNNTETVGQLVQALPSMNAQPTQTEPVKEEA